MDKIVRQPAAIKFCLGVFAFCFLVPIHGIAELNTRDIEEYCQGLRAADLILVQDTLTALKSLGPKAEPIIPCISPLLKSNSFPPVGLKAAFFHVSIGRMAADTLAAIGKPSLSVLLYAVESASAIERRNAIFGLGQISDPAVADGLLTGLKDTEEETRNLARLFLVQGPAQFASAVFIKNYSQGSPFVRSTVLMVLGRIRDRSTADTVLDALSDSNSIVRETALTVLAGARDWINSPRAFAPLIGSLSHKNSFVRSGGARSIGQYKNRRAIAALGPLLNERDISVRVNAALSLGEIGGKDALKMLISRLGNERNSYVRDQILFAIGEIGDAEALPALVCILKGDSSNRFNAGQAFEKIAGKPFFIHPQWKTMEKMSCEKEVK